MDKVKMDKDKKQSKRIFVRVSDDTYEKVERYAKKFGVTMSQLGGMALTGGIDQILRAVDPINTLTEEQLARIFRAGEVAGVEFDIERVLKGAGHGDTVEKEA